jgi:hypothetical protein
MMMMMMGRSRCSYVRDICRFRRRKPFVTAPLRVLFSSHYWTLICCTSDSVRLVRRNELDRTAAAHHNKIRMEVCLIKISKKKELVPYLMNQTTKNIVCRQARLVYSIRNIQLNLISLFLRATKTDLLCTIYGCGATGGNWMHSRNEILFFPIIFVYFFCNFLFPSWTESTVFRFLSTKKNIVFKI